MRSWAVSSAEDSISTRWVAYAFLAAVFFPYVRVLPIGSDVQPLALVLATAIVLASKTGELPKTLSPLFVVMGASILIACLTGVNGLAVRGLANYFSLLLISWATYSVLTTNRGLSTRFVAAVVWIWFIVGGVQTVVARSFLTQVLSNVRTTGNRGVVGLAPEPTSYGIHCLILLILVVDMFRGRQRRILVFAIVVQIVLFARSSMTILFLVVWLLLYAATHYSGRRLMAGAVVGISAALLGLPLIARLASGVNGVRMIALLHLVITSPALVLARDQSVSDRAAAVVFSLMGTFKNFFVPHGFNTWSTFVKEIGPGMIRYLPYYTAGDRIMSGYGAALYELGIFGLLVPFVVTRSIWSRYQQDIRQFMTVGPLLNLLLLTAIPLAYPPIGFLIGYYCYHAAMHSQRPAPGTLKTLTPPLPFSA